jgi:hypothetical protein
MSMLTTDLHTSSFSRRALRLLPFAMLLLLSASRAAAQSAMTGGTSETRAPIARQLGWQRAWTYSLGGAHEGTTRMERDVAVRGSLIAVSSQGVPGANDDNDGVLLFDARSVLHYGAAVEPVRRIHSSINRDQQQPGARDAVGILLDGDYVMFGTLGGVVARARLDGQSQWATVPRPDARPGAPILFDMDGDHSPEVVVPLQPTCRDCAAKSYVLAALDRETGQARQIVSDHEWPAALELCAPDLSVVASTKIDTSTATATLVLGCPASADKPGFAHSYSVQNGELVRGEDCPTNTLRGPSLIAEGLADGGWDRQTLRPHARSLQLTSSTSPLLLWEHPLEGQLSSLPVLGDVDLDGSWDVVFVAAGKLVVLATQGHGRAERTTWPPLDIGAYEVTTPATYATVVEPRDRVRWLMTPQAPGESFEPAPADSDPKRFAIGTDLLQSARAGQTVLTSRTECFGHDYALNEGHLVVLVRDQWHRVPDAPWPIDGMRCDVRDASPGLLVHTPDNKAYRLPAPAPWKWLAVLALAALSALLFVLVSTGNNLPPAPPPEDDVRRVLLSDRPRMNLSEALPRQQRLVEGLLNLIDNRETTPPLSVGLFGPWGSGKSSAMHMLRSELARSGRYVDVWFNAWRFHREVQLGPALLQSICDAVAAKSDTVTHLAIAWRRIKDSKLRDILLFLVPTLLVSFMFYVCVRSTVVLGSLASGALVLAGVWLKLIAPLSKVFALDPARLLSAAPKQRLTFVREFSIELREVMQKLPHGMRLIVFVDDLDRCPPERIVDVLETMNMLADAGSAMFVIGADPVVVRGAIEYCHRDMLDNLRRSGSDDVRDFGTRFMAKLITLGVNVPPLSAAEVDPDEQVPSTLGPSSLRRSLMGLRPPTPWLWAIGLVVMAIMLLRQIAEPYGGVARMADVLAQSLIHKEQETSAHAATEAPEPKKPLESSPTEAPRYVSEPEPSANDELSGLRRKLAEPRPSLAISLVTSEMPSPTPTEELSWSRALSLFIMASSGAVGLLLVGLVISQWRKQRALLAERAVGSDAPLFRDKLRAARAQLPPNPREVVRFTNTARFLYHVLGGDKDRPEHWEDDFFRCLLQHWQGAPLASAQPWVAQELSTWLPLPAAKPQTTTRRFKRTRRL